jgi:uncharacterized Zn-binding protein involved in type VI secretion
MPGFVVHQGANVQCPHGGRAIVVPAARVKVSGMPVAVASVYSVGGCVAPTPPGTCTGGKWVTFSLRVKADGQPIVLSDSQSLSAASGTPLLIIGGQVRVKGS